MVDKLIVQVLKSRVHLLLHFFDVSAIRFASEQTSEHSGSIIFVVLELCYLESWVKI